MHKIDIGDAELAVWRDGQADSGGDPVFLVSGLGGRAAFWSELVPPLASMSSPMTTVAPGPAQNLLSPILLPRWRPMF
jgi:hypothetical protein